MNSLRRSASVAHRVNDKARAARLVAAGENAGHVCHLVLVNDCRALIVHGDFGQVALRRETVRDRIHTRPERRSRARQIPNRVRRTVSGDRSRPARQALFARNERSRLSRPRR